MSDLVAITMPKWGLAMTEGTVTSWWKAVGEPFTEGEDLVDIETTKITNAYEAPFSGRLARIVVPEGELAPVRGLIGVSADEGASEAEIDAFISTFQANFTPEEESEGQGEAEAGLRTELVPVGGREYRAVTLGDLARDKPIVLVHGFAGDLNNWLFNLDALSARAPVIAVELPGHGASDKTLASGDLGELARAVIGVLKGLSVSECVLVGHSLGAAVAMRAALDEPALVRSLILIAPAGLPGSAVDPAFLNDVVDAQTSRRLLPALRRLFADPDLATREMADEMMKFKRLDGADEALAKIAGHVVQGDDFAALEPELHRLPAATIIRGRADAIVSPPDKGAIPSSWRIVEVESGHMPHMERPTEVNSLILEAFAEGEER